MKEMIEKSKDILILWVLCLLGSMIYSLFGFVGVMLFGMLGLLLMTYLINRLIKEFRKEAQAQLEQLKSAYSQARE